MSSAVMGPYRTSLDVLRVDNPCTERWARMEGDDRVRFCKTCDSQVYDLSSMTRAEAEALLTVTEGTACVRFYRRADGRVATVDCTPARARSRRRNTGRGVLAAAALAITAAGAASAPAVSDALVPRFEDDAVTKTRESQAKAEAAWYSERDDEGSPYVMGTLQSTPRRLAPARPTWIDPSELRGPLRR